MRADEHRWDPKGLPTLIDLQAGSTVTGNPDGVKNQIEGDIVQTTVPL